MNTKIIVVVLAIATAVHGSPMKKYAPHFFPDNGKIIGGSDAAAGEIPWQVALLTSGGSLTCGGTIISDEWVLTAAHCAIINPVNYKIRAGSLEYKSGGIIHQILEVVAHEEFESLYYNNDIALLRVDPPFHFDDNVAAVSLPARGTDTPAGTVLTVSGWGTTRYLGTLSDDLQKVEVPIVDKEVCNDSYAMWGGIPPNQICAGLSLGGKDFCAGDAGGPLFKDGVAFGMVSHSIKGCALPDYPGVYIELSAYRDWITQHSGV